MNIIKKIGIFAILVTFLACDDGIFLPYMDLTPPNGGWLWVVKKGRTTGGSAYNGAIYKVDLTTLKHIDGVGAPFRWDQNLGLAFGDGKLWIGGYESGGEFEPTEYYYCWVDPETGEKGPFIDISEYHLTPGGLAWEDPNLWVAGAGYCALFEPYAGELVKGFWLSITGLTGLAWDGSYLWVVKPEDSLSGESGIYRIDPETGEELYGFPKPCDGPVGLTWDGEALWVNDIKENTVYRVSPEDGKILGYFSYDFAGPPWGLAFEFPSE